ncbi:MAG: hypothetical protein QME51_03070, partial [Planctomycetota bacterium]|nr:hypothetical protein [Planctomycetota bacterium]MDI6787335.1 hypothetical protein [Planctomycetota bacterium]
LLFLAEGEINQTKKILEEPSMALKKYVPFLALSAYINYKERKIEKAIKLLEEALAIDPSNLWVRNNLLKITKSAAQSIWVDNFERADNTVIGRGWTENEKYGVEISISNKQCLFKGTQSLKGEGITYLERSISRDSFIRFEARFSIPDIERPFPGIYFATQSKDRILFIALRNNQISYGFSTTSDILPTEWSSFQKPPITAQEFKISLEAVGPKGNPAEFHCFIDDVLFGIIPLKIAFGKPQEVSYLVGVYGYAGLNKKWDMTLKTARVFEEKPK